LIYKFHLEQAIKASVNQRDFNWVGPISFWYALILMYSIETNTLLV